MSTSEQRKAYIDHLLKACGREFPSLMWGCHDTPGTINAIAQTTIPELAATVTVEWFFPTQEYRDGYAVSRIIIGGFAAQEFFRSTQQKGQSLEDSLSKLRHHLEYVNAGLTRDLQYRTLSKVATLGGK